MKKSSIYLAQSRRIAGILRNLLGLSSYWTNYYAWEYRLPNEIELNLVYSNDWNMKRFIFVHGNSRETVLETDSLKEAITFIKKAKGRVFP